MPSIHFRLTRTAYLPEATAYKRYLSERGWSATASLEPASSGSDLEVLFPSHFPFWKTSSHAKAVVYDYTSASVPPLPRLKNIYKSMTERAPDGRIFLNAFVESSFHFLTPRPSIRRDMGIDDAFFEVARRRRPVYDIVYAGSIRGRSGLIPAINRLSALGYRVLLLGEIGGDDRKELAENVMCSGRVAREAVPEFYAQARFGLNYTPNRYPFNQQTSTKTIEYLASGLGVISSRGRWIEDFNANRNAGIHWLEEIGDENSLDKLPISKKNLDDLRWNAVFESAKVDEFFRSIIDRS